MSPGMTGGLPPVFSNPSACAPDRRGERAALIAATALVRGMTAVTRNVQDFKSMGATLLNPGAA